MAESLRQKLKQKPLYKESVLPAACDKVLAIEMGVGDAWYKYADDVMSINEFGASGPAELIIEAYKFTVNDVVNRVKKLLAK